MPQQAEHSSANHGGVSIVVPAYNEEDHIESAVLSILAGARSRHLEFEVVVVQNGSEDETAEKLDVLAAEHAELRVIHLAEPNYGNSLRMGFLESRFPTMVNFSVDIVDFEFFDQALGLIDTYDLVLGSKTADDRLVSRPLSRRIGGAIFHKGTRFLLRIPVDDTHGIKMMRREAVRPVIERCRSGGEIFDDELILRASRRNLTMLEIPFRCEEIRPSRVSVMRRAFRSLRQLGTLRISLWLQRQDN